MDEEGKGRLARVVAKTRAAVSNQLYNYLIVFMGSADVLASL